MNVKFIIAFALISSLIGCKAKIKIPAGDVTTIQPQEFSPANIAGLQLWFKADALPAIADNTPIAIWPDSSANHLDAAQINANARPTYKSAILNGKAVVHFNGTQYMATPGTANILSGHGTLIAVYTSSSPYSVSFVAGFPHSATNATWQAPWVGFEIGTSTNQGRFWLNITGTDREFSAGTLPSNTFHTQSLNFDGTTRNGYINGVSVYSDATANGAITYEGSPPFMLGMRSAISIGEFLNGDIAEVLYYSSALSLSDLQKVENYLKTKYAHY